MTVELPAPMLATAVDTLPEGDEWAYEMKWDGYRAVVGVDAAGVRAITRRGNDAVARFPELAELAEPLGGRDVILDGELVVFDDAGRPTFTAIQQHASPAVFMAFDALRVDGIDLTGRPWRERRDALESLTGTGARWQIPAVVVGGPDAALTSADTLGFEGVVAKRVDSTYRAGRRSSDWQKHKLMAGQELVVGGWLPGEGRLSGTLGSLLVGYYDESGRVLHYAGRVGSGLDDAARAALASRLVPRPDPPFVDAPRLPDSVWVEPDVVAEVRFREWTDDGVLRQPVFLGLRADKNPREVVRE